MFHVFKFFIETPIIIITNSLKGRLTDIFIKENVSYKWELSLPYLVISLPYLIFKELNTYNWFPIKAKISPRYMRIFMRRNKVRLFQFILRKILIDKKIKN